MDLLPRLLRIEVCCCGKLCTSRPGVTQHQKKCRRAQQAKQDGQPATLPLRIEWEGQLLPQEVSAFLEIADRIAADAHAALAFGNKAAGRRARNALLEMRDCVPLLRRQLLEKSKQGK